MSKKYYVGVDLGGTNMRAGVVDADGKIIKSESIPTEADSGPEMALGRLKELIENLIEQSSLSKGDIACVGIGAPGPLDHIRGAFISLPNLPGWDGFELAPKLEAELSVPTFLDNDANCAAWGEFSYGLGRGCSEFAIVTLGTGVGGGLIIDGKLLRGHNCVAGHFGHIVLDPEGRECGCGSRGCVEQYSSASAVANDAKEAVATGVETTLADLDIEDITAQAVSDAAKAGDKFSIELLATAGRNLGIAIASMANLIDPEVVAIYGGLTGAGDLLLEPCLATVNSYVLAPIAKNIKVGYSLCGGDTGILGAASLGAERLKEDAQ